MRRRIIFSIVVLGLLAAASHARGADEHVPAPYQKPPVADVKQWTDAQLVSFMRELTDYVYAHHVVMDERTKTYGMTYEFYRDGKKMQSFGLDTMHDGLWFTSAMIAAQRADPDGHYLERAQKYQVPFYCNMLNHSDVLFPAMQTTNEDRKPFSKPVKGWVPRGWDEGIGYQHEGKQERFHEGYFTSSNHLAEDIASVLLNVWLTTRDPAVAEAITHLRDYKREYYGPIPAVEYAYAVISGQPKLAKGHPFLAFSPAQLGPWYTGGYELAKASLPSYDDGLAWAYREATADYLTAGKMHEEFLISAAARATGMPTAMEMFYDDRPYPYGMYFFDIQRQPSFAPGGGVLDDYVSRTRRLFGARGIEISWVGAGILPSLARQPQLWDEVYRKAHPDDQIIRIVDDPPATDGKREEAYGKSAQIGAEDAGIWLLSDPKNLHIFIESSRRVVALRIYQAVGDGANRSPFLGDVRAFNDGVMSASAGGGQSLLVEKVFVPGATWKAEFRVPYAVVPGQQPWLNGIEGGRYTLTDADEKPHTICLLSESNRIIQRLHDSALGTVATWHDVWKQLGIIPSGYRNPSMKSNSWEISDAGNYAHLIHDIALLLIYRHDASEAQIIREQFPADPKPAPPLPDGVLKAQGLR